MFFYKFAAYFQNTFSQEYVWKAASVKSAIGLYKPTLFYQNVTGHDFRKKRIIPGNNLGALFILCDNVRKPAENVSDLSSVILFQVES